MEADAVLRQAAQRVVQRLDRGIGELAVLLDGRLGIDLVEVLGDRRIVDLQHEAGIDDRLVLLAHRVGAGEDELLVALVVVGCRCARQLAGPIEVMKPSLTPLAASAALKLAMSAAIASWPV